MKSQRFSTGLRSGWREGQSMASSSSRNCLQTFVTWGQAWSCTRKGLHWTSIRSDNRSEDFIPILHGTGRTARPSKDGSTQTSLAVEPEYCRHKICRVFWDTSYDGISVMCICMWWLEINTLSVNCISAFLITHAWCDTS